MHLVASPRGGKLPCPVRLSLRVTADGVGLYGDVYCYADACWPPVFRKRSDSSCERASTGVSISRGEGACRGRFEAMVR